MPYKKSIEKICIICKSKFYVEHNRKDSAKFCSQMCKANGLKGITKTPKNRICEWCKKSFKGFKGQKWRFCSRECYDKNRFTNKPCKDCFSSEFNGELCKKHSAEKQTKWRLTASKKELKAKSMQGAYRQASEKTLTLSLDEARSIIENPPLCIYCEQPIPWNKLSVDHKQPKSRGGLSNKDNLVWVDLDCNLIKGNMTMEEYIDFLSFIRKHPTVEQYLIPRLKSGGGAIYGRKKIGG